MNTKAATPTTKTLPANATEVLQRYPILTAHLVCESLGYLTPTAAANAIRCHQARQPFACEWYLHQAQSGRTLLQVGADNLQNAFRNRRHHRGPMAHYPLAIQLVREEISHARTTLLQSW